MGIEFKQDLASNSEMKAFVESLKLDTPLGPCEPFLEDKRTLFVCSKMLLMRKQFITCTLHPSIASQTNTQKCRLPSWYSDKWSSYQPFTPVDFLVLSRVTFFCHRFCFTQCFCTVHKESWRSLYVECAQKIYNNLPVNTMNKNACCLGHGVLLNSTRLWIWGSVWSEWLRCGILSRNHPLFSKGMLIPFKELSQKEVVGCHGL